MPDQPTPTTARRAVDAPAAAGDSAARRFLADYLARHEHPRGLGCSAVAHRDLGFCATCVREHEPDRGEWFPSATEITGWRLLAMAERGAVDWTTGGTVHG